MPRCLIRQPLDVLLSLTWKRDFSLPDNMVAIFFLVPPLVSLVVVSEKCVLRFKSDSSAH